MSRYVPRGCRVDAPASYRDSARLLDNQFFITREEWLPSSFERSEKRTEALDNHFFRAVVAERCTESAAADRSVIVRLDNEWKHGVVSQPDDRIEVTGMADAASPHAATVLSQRIGRQSIRYASKRRVCSCCISIQFLANGSSDVVLQPDLQ